LNPAGLAAATASILQDCTAATASFLQLWEHRKHRQAMGILLQLLWQQMTHWQLRQLQSCRTGSSYSFNPAGLHSSYSFNPAGLGSSYNFQSCGTGTAATAGSCSFGDTAKH
jgi:hypothetical protein